MPNFKNVFCACNPVSMASSSKPPLKEKPKKDKAAKEKTLIWTPTMLKLFLDLLISYQRKYGREQGFSWVMLTTQFEEMTGQKCGPNTLKNKYAGMKEKWKDWKDLKHGETGLGWDYERGCINATDEWWERKCQVSNVLSWCCGYDHICFDTNLVCLRLSSAIKKYCIPVIGEGGISETEEVGGASRHRRRMGSDIRRYGGHGPPLCRAVYGSI